MADNFNQAAQPVKHDLIMFNMSAMSDWDSGIVNRNYFILNELSRADIIDRIIAVDFFPVGVKKAIKHYWRNILRGQKNHEIIYGDLTSACYKKTAKLYVYSSIDSIFSWKIAARELRRLEKILNIKNPIFWSYNPLFTEFIGKLDEQLFIFDAVDNWLEHPSCNRLMSKEKLTANYQTIAAKADLIFTVSEDLVYFFKCLNRSDNVYHTPNGVDYQHFNDPEIVNQENQLTAINQPIIGYLGTIQERVDLDLLAFIAAKNPDKKIALCGPLWPSIRAELKTKLGKFNNIIYTGRVPYSQSPSYISRFAVAIIPHKINDFCNSMDPMKLYEYLAGGKPVVAVTNAGLFNDQIRITGDYQLFNQFINQEIQSDSAAKQARRRQAVQPHSWQNRCEFMLGKIINQLNER